MNGRHVSNRAAALLELTVDLREVHEHAVDILADRRLRDARRYIAGPPISDDDWKTLADA